MNQRSISIGVIALSAILFAPAGAFAQQKANQEAANEDPVGYFLGVSIGQTMFQQGFKPGDFKPDSLAAGVVDALAELDPALNDEQLKEVRGQIEGLLRSRQKEIEERQQQRQKEMVAEYKKLAAENKEKSAVFMKEIAGGDGIKALDGGLQYKVLKSGDGASPSASDTVKVHYTGKLISGKVFDSSVQRGTPAQFQVGRVIKGWQMALQEMKIGDKWMLYIPPDLAYGERGSGGDGRIGPNEVLVFEVELLDII